MKARLSALLLGLCAACSGSEGDRKETAPAAHSEAPARAAVPPAEQKLRAAQEAAVEALCERLVDCSIESAHANMSPEEVAKLDIEKTSQLLRDECRDAGTRSDYSPRQIRIIQRCVNEAKTCDALQTCLDEAKKEPTSSR